jgi:hypothetical protein
MISMRDGHFERREIVWKGADFPSLEYCFIERGTEGWLFSSMLLERPTDIFSSAWY